MSTYRIDIKVNLVVWAICVLDRLQTPVWCSNPVTQMQVTHVFLWQHAKC